MDQRQQGEASFAMAWQAGKAQGNQIVRTLESHTPEIDSSCLEGRPELRPRGGGDGRLCFQNTAEARV